MKTAVTHNYPRKTYLIRICNTVFSVIMYLNLLYFIIPVLHLLFDEPSSFFHIQVINKTKSRSWKRDIPLLVILLYSNNCRILVKTLPAIGYKGTRSVHRGYEYGHP